MRTTMARGLVALVIVGLLAACGQGADKARAEHQARAEAREGAGRSADAAAALDADMVSAVTTGSSTTPVGLKFRLKEPPRVGQTLHLDLALMQEPGLDIDSIVVSFQPSEGLALESDHLLEFHTPVVGATQRLVVALRAQQPGLQSLNATVLVDSGSTSVARVFSIPLIAVDAPQ